MYSAIAAKEGLSLDLLLRLAGLPPNDVVVIGHAPREPELRKVLPWLITERPALFGDYQAIQSGVAALTLRRARYLASFIKLSPQEATFAGFYEVAGVAPLAPQDFWSAPGLLALKELGYEGSDQTSAHLSRFELVPTSRWQEWVGRLIVVWPKGRAICRRVANHPFPLLAINQESCFGADIPAWDQVVLSWGQLQALPPSWHAALLQWRGVYYIFDKTRRAGYVGSATGPENLLGRWRGYGDTGHGGNKLLRECRPEDLTFSILQLTAPDLPRDAVVAIEGSWKARLHTRKSGLNLN